jgi:hypothetical protein
METGLIMVEGALIGTTEFDIFSIDPSTCAENWRTHEEYPAYILPTTNRDGGRAEISAIPDGAANAVSSPLRSNRSGAFRRRV